MLTNLNYRYSSGSSRSSRSRTLGFLISQLTMVTAEPRMIACCRHALAYYGQKITRNREKNWGEMSLPSEPLVILPLGALHLLLVGEKNFCRRWPCNWTFFDLNKIKTWIFLERWKCSVEVFHVRSMILQRFNDSTNHTKSFPAL